MFPNESASFPQCLRYVRPCSNSGAKADIAIGRLGVIKRRVRDVRAESAFPSLATDLRTRLYFASGQ
jgi:hypothetical protein